ncbi:MAG: recombinase family protein [Petrotogales bacterium]
MIKAVGYCRVSTKNKGQESSLPNQKEMIKEHAQKQGYEYVKTFSEKITSKKKPLERPQFKELLSYSLNKEIDKVIVKHRDRLVRDPAHLFITKDQLQNEGIELEAVKGDLSFDKTEEEMFTMIKSYMDKMEREKINAKIKATYDRKKKRGDHMGTPPTGMTYNKKKTQFIPGEDFDKVEEAFELRVKGKSYNKITKKTGISRGTVYRMMNDNLEYYLPFIDFSKEDLK